MNKGFLNRCLLQSRPRIILLVLLVTFNCVCLFIALSGSFSPSAAQDKSAASQLAGQWQIAFPSSSGQPLTIIFTPEGKLFFIDKTSSGAPAAYEVARRISEATTLPPNTQIISLEQTISNLTEGFKEQANRTRESEAKQYILSMNRGQQAYYLENGKFSSSIEQLGVGIKPETNNYRYQIVPQGNQTQRVMTTAQAKLPELRSYTGAVFLLKINDESTTFAGICETDRPSSMLPGMPTPPKNVSEKIQCPAGSHPL